MSLGHNEYEGISALGRRSEMPRPETGDPRIRKIDVPLNKNITGNSCILGQSAYCSFRVQRHYRLEARPISILDIFQAIHQNWPDRTLHLQVDPVDTDQSFSEFFCINVIVQATDNLPL